MNRWVRLVDVRIVGPHLGLPDSLHLRQEALGLSATQRVGLVLQHLRIGLVLFCSVRKMIAQNALEVDEDIQQALVPFVMISSFKETLDRISSLPRVRTLNWRILRIASDWLSE